ncbi:hypothetical protein ACFW7J_10150 [Streptomyces sp. NPDC059525]|uniref:hypothetical protein n=1 Tax=Streptomyces sp. NPDC059525 TaxID=3346857 RepID=UPI00367ED752
MSTAAAPDPSTAGTAVGIDDDSREALVLFETGSHRSHHVVPPGPQLHEHEGERCLQVLEQLISDRRYVVASGSLPGGLHDAYYAAVARRVRAAGARLILDTSGPASVASAAHQPAQENNPGSGRRRLGAGTAKGQHPSDQN